MPKILRNGRGALIDGGEVILNTLVLNEEVEVSIVAGLYSNMCNLTHAIKSIPLFSIIPFCLLYDFFY